MKYSNEYLKENKIGVIVRNKEQHLKCKKLFPNFSSHNDYHEQFYGNSGIILYSLGGWNANSEGGKNWSKENNYIDITFEEFIGEQIIENYEIF